MTVRDLINALNDVIDGRVVQVSSYGWFVVETDAGRLVQINIGNLDKYGESSHAEND